MSEMIERVTDVLLSAGCGTSDECPRKEHFDAVR